MNLKNVLEEKTYDIINESVYDMKQLEAYYRHIEQAIGPGVKRENLSLTKSFQKYFSDVTRSAVVFLRLMPEEPGKTSSTKIEVPDAQKKEEKPNGRKVEKEASLIALNRRTQKGTRVPVIVISVWIDREEHPLKFKSAFLHELIHALDALKRYKKERRIPRIESVIKSQRELNKLIADKSSVSPEVFKNYRTNIEEFNQAINFIAKYKNGAYRKIETVDGLVKWFIERASGSYRKYDELVEALKSDVDFRKKLLKRLARENLLPKGLKY